MYKISDNQYAIEAGDCIEFVKDGGGEVNIFDTSDRTNLCYLAKFDSVTLICSKDK